MSDDGHEKYGVVTEEEPKTASHSDHPRCPEPACGARINMNANVPQCPVCGTKPFEKRDGAE